MHQVGEFRAKNYRGGRLTICRVNFFNFSLSARIFRKGHATYTIQMVCLVFMLRTPSRWCVQYLYYVHHPDGVSSIRTTYTIQMVCLVFILSTPSRSGLPNPQTPWGRHFFDKYNALKSKIKQTKRSQIFIINASEKSNFFYI